VIPNGIDATGASPWRPTAANRGVVGTVATFRPKKNIPLLIRAYARLPRALRRGLLLVGDAYEANKFVPAAREAIERTIDEVGIRDEATVTGLVDHQHLSEQHQRMGVFALSSDHEGMPNAILEAGSIGLPIVATAVDGVKDVFTDGVDARLVPPGDEAALVAALERVLADDALAHRLSANARQTVSRLTVAAELQRYVDVYEALLAERRAPVDVPQAEGVS
jgi:glycosyltransferase involved in cell wall biosynthesis